MTEKAKFNERKRLIREAMLDSLDKGIQRLDSIIESDASKPSDQIAATKILVDATIGSKVEQEVEAEVKVQISFD